MSGNSEELLLNQLLTLCKERNWLKAKGQQRSDSTHILARIRAVNRVECIGETMRYALNSLAALVPDWLSQQPILADEWITRYGHRMEDYRLPATTEKRISYARQIGQDGFDLLRAIEEAPNRDILWQLPAVNTLRVVWLQQFHLCDQQLVWRTEKEGLPPAARFISSPYDVQARYGRKNPTSWVGYKVHITETCEDDQPNLITQVVTTTGPISDGAVTGVIHQALEDKDLLPTTHIVDTGYTDAELLVISRQRYGVDLLGPTRADYKWQARAKGGFAAADFKLDWSAKQAVCPQGQSSKSWTQIIEKGQSKVIIKFSQKVCGNCLVHSQCTTGKRRSVTLRSEAHHHALVLAREREQTAEYRKTYARRAGIDHPNLSGRSGFWFTALPVRWFGQNASSTCADCRSDQP